jgi:hypothetical protein
LGVQGVGLAAPAAVAAVGSVDLQDFDAGLGQVPGDTGPVAAGAFDADLAEVAKAAHPAQHGPVAGPGGGERLGPQHDRLGVDDRSDVQVLVGVDAADHHAADGVELGWHAGHVGPPC